MSKFEVILKDIEVYVIEVEADDEGEAIDVATEMLTGDNADKNREKYHHDSDGEVEAYLL